MRIKIALSIMVAALTIMFLVALAVYPEAAEARTTAELQADVNLLNQLTEDLSYSDCPLRGCGR